LSLDEGRSNAKGTITGKGMGKSAAREGGSERLRTHCLGRSDTGHTQQYQNEKGSWGGSEKGRLRI